VELKFTETAVSPEVADGGNRFFDMKKAGNSYVVEIELSQNQDSDQSKLELEKGFAAIADLKVTGGFAGSDRATLAFTGTQRGYEVLGRVNMHLENGQWKQGETSVLEEILAKVYKRDRGLTASLLNCFVAQTAACLPPSQQ